MSIEDANLHVQPLRLHYAQPAARWLEALPVGGGRLGAMVHGGVAEERISLNDVTFWSGAADHRHVNPSGKSAFEEIRALYTSGGSKERIRQLAKSVLGIQANYGTSLPAGDLLILQNGIEDATGYVRDLDLRRAVASVAFVSNGVNYRREVFASHPAQIIAIRLSADRAASLSMSITYDAPALPWMARTNGSELVVSGDARESRQSDGETGVSYRAHISVQANGGTVSATTTAIQIAGADEVLIYVALNTDMFNANPEAVGCKQIDAARALGWSNLLEQHVADHRALFERVELDLGGTQRATIATDVRLAAQRRGEIDPDLSRLFFQYGRYLLIAGSREDSPLPLHLQGIWNDGLAAAMAWTCDYHLDINVQQQYWLTEVGNISECNAPLFRLITGLEKSGRRTARDLYGINRGWIAHIFTNAWGFTAPGWGMGWGLHITGGAWIATHFWEHYQFWGDNAFLADTAYPLFKGMSEFFLDYLYVDPVSGHLFTGPSVSPEIGGEDKPGNAHDSIMIRALFDATIEASEILGVDEALRAEIAAARVKLPPLKIGRNGQLQEWFHEDDGGETGHRHTSHIAALYPLRQISPEKTPELAAAALRALEIRMNHPGWEDVEWSAANAVCYHTALRDGEQAHRALLNLINEDTDDSLLTFSRGGIAGAPQNIFAIDGNTAGATGIAEMLLQSEGDTIDLLPALPSAWPNGRVTGLRARGGVGVDLEWKDGKVASYRLTSATPKTVTVRSRGVANQVTTTAA